MSDTSSQDTFAAGRANIRDTVKWLVAALAALGALVIGSSPFTGFGQLKLPYLLAAIGSGLLGVSLVFWAIDRALRILVTPLFFLGQIRQDDHLAALIRSNSKDLLPPLIDDLDRFLAYRRLLLMKLAKEQDTEKRKKLEQNYQAVQAVTTRLVGLCNYENLRRKFDATRRQLFLLGGAITLALGTFAWATTHSDKHTEDAVRVICDGGKISHNGARK